MVPFHACTIKVDYEVHQSLFEIHGDLYSDTGVVDILARSHQLLSSHSNSGHQQFQCEHARIQVS